MNRFCRLVFSLFFILLVGVVLLPQVTAATLKNATVTVSATVGNLSLSLSGIVSPYASIGLSSNGAFLRGSVADQNGNFSITDVTIQQGFSSFCLTVVDIKRLGESVTCFSIAPATANIVMTNIFLPPTLGLYRTEINAGSDALAFGYTMPYAKVRIRLSNGKVYTITANSKGRYQITIPKLSAGTYILIATAVYNGQQSQTPTKGVQLKALSLYEQVRKQSKKSLTQVASVPLGLLWLLIPLLIIILLLAIKLWPEWFGWFFFLWRRKNKKDKENKAEIMSKFVRE